MNCKQTQQTRYEELVEPKKMEHPMFSAHSSSNRFEDNLLPQRKSSLL